MSWKALAPVIFLGAVSAQIDIEPPTGVVSASTYSHPSFFLPSILPTFLFSFL
jgi:hypothetical protein